MKDLQLTLKVNCALIASDIPTSRIIEIELTAPKSNKRNDPAPLNLALVIDRSGSMSCGKLEQAKSAAEQIINLMREKDSLSLVVYDNQITVLAEAVSMTPAAQAEMVSKLQHVHTGSNTNLSGGWLQGCECVARRQNSNGVNRVLLLTDGLANEGITSVPELTLHASEIIARGISTSTFGIGEGFNEHLLEGMANNGGGNYYFIESAESIPGLLMEEFHDLATVTIRNVVLHLNFPDGVAAELFGEWRNEQADHKCVVYLSDLSANHKVNLFVRLLTPPGDGQLIMNAVISGLDEEDRRFQAASELSLQYASRAKVNSAARDLELESRFASVAVGQLSNEALKLERERKREEARHVMERVMAEFGEQLPSPTRQRYQRMSEEIGSGFSEFNRKSMNRDAYMLKKHRHIDQHREDNN